MRRTASTRFCLLAILTTLAWMTAGKPEDSIDLLEESYDTAESSLTVVTDDCQTRKVVRVIKEPGCEPFNLTTKMCFGYCPSSVYTSNNGRKLIHRCKVCKPSEFETLRITIHCYTGLKVREWVKRDVIKKCGCLSTKCHIHTPQQYGNRGNNRKSKRTGKRRHQPKLRKNSHYVPLGKN